MTEEGADFQGGFAISLLFCLTLCLFQNCLLSSVRAQESRPIQAKELSEAPLVLDPSWRSGFLRLTLRGLPATEWRVRLDYGASGILELRPDNIKSRLARQQGDALYVDVPIVAGTLLSAKTEPAGISVHAVEAFTPRMAFPEQMIPKSEVISLGAGMTATDKTIAPAFARAELLSANGIFLGTCTAFRVVKAYWLTAAHCAYRDAEHASVPPITRLRLQPEDYAGRVENAEPFIGTAIASGLNASQPTPETIMASSDLDYALLYAPADGGGATISLPAGMTSTATGTKLVLYEHWTGDLPPPAGKARAEGEACRVLERAGPNDRSRPELCPSAIQHGCSSQSGASGGPLMEAGSVHLVGVHYGAGLTSKFNCALPSAVISQDLCKRHGDIARKVISCP